MQLFATTLFEEHGPRAELIKDDINTSCVTGKIRGKYLVESTCFFVRALQKAGLRLLSQKLGEVSWDSYVQTIHHS